jgi:hypothetical protein
MTFLLLLRVVLGGARDMPRRFPAPVDRFASINPLAPFHRGMSLHAFFLRRPVALPTIVRTR